MTFAPRRLASFCAARVSAVSPDWVITIMRLPLGIRGFLYLNSDAISTSQGIRAISSSIYLPMSAACHDVPQATRKIFFRFFNRLSFRENSSRFTVAFSTENLPLIVSAIALGCSYISFSIKCLYPPFSAIVGLQVIFMGVFLTGLFLRILRIETPSRVITAISSFSRTITFRVYLRKAGISDARKNSPSPSPRTSGLSFFTARILSGSDSLITPIA